MIPHSATDARYTTHVVYSAPLQVHRFALSVSYAFINKDTVKALQNPSASAAQKDAWRKQAMTDFAPGRFTLEDLKAHILAGRAWMPALHKARQRSKASFQSAQLMALDFDNNEAGTLGVSVQALKQHPIVGPHAAFIYATPSSTPARPKSRALFVLDETINSVSEYERLAAALMDMCADLCPDSACKDASRLFFGSKGGEHA